MKWSNEKPTQPGWYWIKEWNGETVIFKVIMENGVLGVMEPDDGCPTIGAFSSLEKYWDGYMWAGPIEEPE